MLTDVEHSLGYNTRVSVSNNRAWVYLELSLPLSDEHSLGHTQVKVPKREHGHANPRHGTLLRIVSGNRSVVR
jgi:hypothetical protein